MVLVGHHHAINPLMDENAFRKEVQIQKAAYPGAWGDSNYSVGISFFLRENLQDQIEDIWRMEIEPYLEEYFFDRQQAVADFRWEKVRGSIFE